MRSAGVVVSIASKRPAALVVVLDGDHLNQTLVEKIRLTTIEPNAAAQAHDLASNLRNRLKGLAVERVIVRRADFPPRASNKEGPRLRLLMEGALAFASMDQVKSTSLLVGKDLAALTDLSKADLDAFAAEKFDAEFAQAAAAAIAAMR